MKFLERFTMVIYSYIIIVLSVVASLIIFNWVKFNTIAEMTQVLLTGVISSKVILGTSIVFILLSLKNIFFDESSKEKIKESQGILLKNENGQLLISKETIDNMVKNAVTGFENVKQCNTKIDVTDENQLKITLFLTVNENVVIKELASNLQTKIKNAIKKTSDLEVEAVNIKIRNIEYTQEEK